jgi:uncharacterized protein YjbI with pentapeptide repeats
MLVPDLREADLSQATLNGANLREADLSQANLSRADLCYADLCGAHLRRADLRQANLRWANLSGADLGEGATLSGANLHAADLVGTLLRNADLSGADLREANLSRADLRDANLSEANLSEADRHEADLAQANFSRADLRGADLSQARLSQTIFGDTDLRGAQGLGACQHWGPSTLDHRTLVRSGRLPLAFLRGCGLPDKLIDYLPSLLNEPIQFYSCFISYTTRDEGFAQRLHADLQDNGVRCWFAPHDIQGGKKIHEQIDEAIRIYDRLLLVLSGHSINSEWVRTEIAKARKRELRENRRMLFPVRLVDYETLRDWECFDADTGKDSAREIREYFIPDFSNWRDHDHYQQAFQSLLKDLKADEST